MREIHGRVNGTVSASIDIGNVQMEEAPAQTVPAADLHGEEVPMKRHNVRRLLALVLVAALCLLCGAAAQPNATEIHIYSADDLVQLSKSCKLDTYSQGKTVYLDNDVDLSGSDFVPIPTFGGMFEGRATRSAGWSSRAMRPIWACFAMYRRSVRSVI